MHGLLTNFLLLQKYEVEFLLTQTWVDPRLRYNDGGIHDYLKGRAHIDDIWIPDTYFIKHGEFREHLVPKNMGLTIVGNGTVSYTMRYNFMNNITLNRTCSFPNEL